MVKPGWEAASDPAWKAFEARNIEAAPESSRTYGDQFKKTPEGPWERCVLSSLTTAATKPNPVAAAIPSRAAFRPVLGRCPALPGR
jgi:hypothetical protein